MGQLGHLSMSHSRAIVSAEEVQPRMRAHDIPVNLLHHLRILYTHCYRGGLTTGPSCGQDVTADPSTALSSLTRCLDLGPDFMKCAGVLTLCICPEISLARGGRQDSDRSGGRPGAG